MCLSFPPKTSKLSKSSSFLKPEKINYQKTIQRNSAQQIGCYTFLIPLWKTFALFPLLVDSRARLFWLEFSPYASMKDCQSPVPHTLILTPCNIPKLFSYMYVQTHEIFISFLKKNPLQVKTHTHTCLYSTLQHRCTACVVVTVVRVCCGKEHYGNFYNAAILL